MNTALVERDGPVVTVIVNLPEARNAVDNPTAEAKVTAPGRRQPPTEFACVTDLKGRKINESDGKLNVRITI